MRALAITFLIALSACSAAPQTNALISQHDILMNRPNSATPEAVFRMFDDGTGTVDFFNGPSGPQDIRWSMRGPMFCIDQADGLLGSFGCAAMSVDGDAVSFVHGPSGGVVTGTLTAR